MIRNWGLSPARVEIDGQPVPAGKDLRIGSVHRLEGDDLVVWIRKDATAPLRITVAPAGPDPAAEQRTAIRDRRVLGRGCLANPRRRRAAGAGTLRRWYIIYTEMDFEFDDRKSRSNKDKHGIDFVDAQALWEDPDVLEVPLTLEDEPRTLVVGRIGSKHWSAIVTERRGRVRIISVRRSRDREKDLYES